MATPKIVMRWQDVLSNILPKNFVPKKPAMMAPNKGANGIASKRMGLSVCVIVMFTNLSC
jgi:hypothetical protein